MRTLVVVKAEKRTECGRATSRAAIGKTVRPVSQERLDETFRFAVGLWAIRPREAMPDCRVPTDGRKDPGSVRAPVIGQQAPDADAPLAIPGQRATQKGGTRVARISGEHFRVGQSRRIIDGHVQKLPPDAADPRAPIAVNPMTDPGDTSEPFQIHMEEIAGIWPLVAADHRGRLEQRDPI